MLIMYNLFPTFAKETPRCTTCHPPGTPFLLLQGKGKEPGKEKQQQPRRPVYAIYPILNYDVPRHL